MKYFASLKVTGDFAIPFQNYGWLQFSTKQQFSYIEEKLSPDIKIHILETQRYIFTRSYEI